MGTFAYLPEVKALSSLFWDKGVSAMTVYMPFADIAGTIAGLTKVVGQCLQIRRQDPPVAKDRRLRGIQPGLQTGSGRGADRLAGKRVMDVRPPPGHAVKVGGQVKGVAMNPSRIPALLVREKNNDVGLVCAVPSAHTSLISCE